MAKNYSANEAIEYDDLNYAYSKYKKANNRWRNHWWDAVVAIFQKSKKWAEKYILDLVKKELFKIGETVAEVCEKVASEIKQHTSGVKIIFAPTVEAFDIPKTEKIYLFKFFEKDCTEPLFTKIGTTTRTCVRRAKEEIAYYLKQFDLEKVEIDAIHDCGDMPAESYESFLRAMFTKKYPNTWKRNDRFFGVDISQGEFSKACAQFAALEI